MHKMQNKKMEINICIETTAKSGFCVKSALRKKINKKQSVTNVKRVNCKMYYKSFCTLRCQFHTSTFAVLHFIL